MRVIVAGDDPVTSRLLEATLRGWEYEVVSCPTGTAAQAALRNDDARLLICDWMLPKMSGLELCRWLRQVGVGHFVYIIILSARDRREDVIEGLNAGADDYLVKPFDRQELEVRVRAGQRVIDLQKELLAAQERLRQLADHDGLTGLLNHQAILKELVREFSRHVRLDSPVSVVMADLDRFKQVNDTHGHAVGDAVLAEVAQRIRRTVRPYDSVGRYGGEEFLVVLPGCDVDGARNSAERLRLAVSDRSIPTAAGPISITMSLGVAGTSAAPDASPSDLVHMADVALYRAKDAERNCTVAAECAL
jgi:diguanylate cyclase (GGDEF)-like protein